MVEMQGTECEGEGSVLNVHNRTLIMRETPQFAMLQWSLVVFPHRCLLCAILRRVAFRGVAIDCFCTFAAENGGVERRDAGGVAVSFFARGAATRKVWTSKNG